MDIENFIESKYQELQPYINTEFIDLYIGIEHPRLREIFTTLHFMFVSTYKMMNERLPTDEYTAHFWAGPSRELIMAIDVSTGMQRTLKNCEYAFNIDPYYDNLIMKSREFLVSSGGSEIPPHMEKVNIYYTLPIFIPNNSVTLNSPFGKKTFDLKFLGEGSYANVYKYQDTFYQTWFVLKRAKKDLDEKELIRFRREFEQMHELHSPYIVEVYCYNDKLNQYIMEYMDCTLNEYMIKNNGKLTCSQRKNIVNQVLKAFQYIHAKGLLHRDINPKNVLLKLYDDIAVVKVADFGLIKLPNSTLTTSNTDFKGYFNDPALIVEGFESYGIVHETYALTRLIYFIMTGKTNASNNIIPSMQKFIEKGLSSDKSTRYQSVDELQKIFQTIKF